MTFYDSWKFGKKLWDIEELVIQKVFDMGQKWNTRLSMYLCEYRNKCLDDNIQEISVSPSSWSIENVSFNNFTGVGFHNSYNSLVTLKQTKLLRCKYHGIEESF